MKRLALLIVFFPFLLLAFILLALFALVALPFYWLKRGIEHFGEEWFDVRISGQVGTFCAIFSPVILALLLVAAPIALVLTPFALLVQWVSERCFDREIPFYEALLYTFLSPLLLLVGLY